MDDTWAFILLFAVFNLWECVFWIHRNAFLFQVSWRGSTRFAAAGDYLGNRIGGLVLCNPFPPLITVFRSSAAPVTLTADGAFAYVSTVFTRTGRPPYSGNTFTYEAMENVSADADRLLINGETFVRCPSSFSAHAAADLLNTLRKTPAKQRQKILEKTFEESFSPDSLTQTLERFRARVRPLTFLCNGYWFYIFILFPMILLGSQGYGPLYLFACGLPVLHLPVLLLFYRIHRGLFPDTDFPHARGERFIHLLHMGLFPPAAIRAVDALSIHLSTPYHPLTVAAVLCNEKRFRRLARQWLLDLKHPLKLHPLPPQLEQADHLYRQWMVKHIETLLSQKKITPEELLGPPETTDKDTEFAVYCPRCFCRYAAGTETCEDCTGVGLTAAAAPGD